MKLFALLERTHPGERYGPPVVPVPRHPHRPRRRFRLRVESPEDVRRARRRGLPLLLVQSLDLTILHYPLRIPDTLLVPREYEGMLETPFHLRTFQAMTPFERPRIEDVVVFLLMYDPLAARAVIDRNLDLLDLAYLRKRIFQEEVEEASSLVHLQDYVDVPVVGSPLPRDALMRAVQANRVTGVLP